MGNKTVILGAILVILIVVDVSDAEFLWNFRKLVASEDLNVTGSPTPSPAVGNEKGKENKDKQMIVPVPVPAPPPVSTKEHNETSRGKVKEDDHSPKEEVKEKQTDVGGNESCDGVERRCKDDKSMVACIKSFDDVSKALVLLIQNKGDNNLKVGLTSFSSGNKQEVIEIPKLQTKQVNMSLAVGGNEIKLDAGNGLCVLHLDLGFPAFQGNFSQWMPSYSKLMTPIYGAYLMLAITLIAGGVCACCWFRKRKRHSDVPYQELELSRPESAAAPTESAEGWDEVWDDDWDEEKAVKSPGHSISANGLTSRAPKKDDWEEWDD